MKRETIARLAELAREVGQAGDLDGACDILQFSINKAREKDNETRDDIEPCITCGAGRVRR